MFDTVFGIIGGCVGVLVLYTVIRELFNHKDTK